MARLLREGGKMERRKEVGKREWEKINTHFYSPPLYCILYSIGDDWFPSRSPWEQFDLPCDPPPPPPPQVINNDLALRVLWCSIFSWSFSLLLYQMGKPRWLRNLYYYCYNHYNFIIITLVSFHYNSFSTYSYDALWCVGRVCYMNLPMAYHEIELSSAQW